MNIFLVTSVPLVPPWDQGDKNLAYTLASALPQHRFRVLTVRGEPAPEGRNLDLEPAYHSRHPSLVEKADLYWRLLSRPPRQPNGTAPGRPPDLYHLVYQPYALSSRLSRWLPEFRRQPTLHTVPATTDGKSLSRDLFFADRVIAMSEHGRHTLHGLGLHGVLHIPPGIDVERWQALQGKTERFKAGLGLEGRPVVLFPGHYGPGQGADTMFHGLPYLAAQVPGVHVVFACRHRSPGDQEREKALRQAAERMGLAENVRFYNVAADMETLIGASDVVALPLGTMRDKVDIPITLLEAMAAGKPIVISDLAPMNELLSGSACPDPTRQVGLAVPADSVQLLAEALVSLLRDRPLRERMGQNGQALVRARFDIRQVARQYEQLYQEMVS